MFRHLKDVNLTYSRHLTQAIYYSFLSWKASVFFFIHGFWPDVFISNGSKIITYLHNRLKIN